MIPVGNFSCFFLYHGRRDGNEEGEEAANGGDDPENLQARTNTPTVGSPSDQGRNQAAYTGTETQGHAGSKTNVAGKVGLSQDDHGTVRRKRERAVGTKSRVAVVWLVLFVRKKRAGTMTRKDIRMTLMCPTLSARIPPKKS